MASSNRMRSTSERNFRTFIVLTSREITDDLLNTLKFLCKDDLAEGDIESTKKPLKFLELLWTRGKIWPGDVGYLTAHLETAGNINLADKVKEWKPRRTSNLPRQSNHFVGRDAVVNQIREKLKSNSSRMIIIIALPGMGKTEVAICVGHKLQNEHQKWPVVYVKEKKLIEICQEILFQVDHRHWTLNSDVISHCKRKLSELEDDTIIILDNAEDAQKEEEFDDFFKHLVMFAPKIRTIITTQYDIKSDIPASGIFKIRLDPLDPSSSSELLMQLAPRISERYAEEIGELCGRVPLFLVSCSCSMMADGFCPEVFTRELRKNPVRVLRDSEHLTSIYKNIGRFFAHLLPKHVLRNLVRLSVFPTKFSVNDIRFLFNDDYEAEAVKTKMIQCCLLKKVNDGDFFTIHPLVKTYCKAERETLNMGEEGRAAENAFNHHYLEILKGLHILFLTKDSSLEAIRKFRDDKANIMEAFENCLCDTSELKEKVFAVDVANEVVDFLAKVLSPPMECTTLYQKCCKFARDSGDEKRLADSLNSSGFRCLDDAAHCKSVGADYACEKFEEACSIFRGLPEETQKCEKYAHVTSKLGLCVLLQGDVNRGRKLILEGIKLREELGLELFVAAGNCDLGHSYRHCRDYKKALDTWKTKTLPVYMEQLGSDHPWTASIIQHIASMYLELAREDRAQYAALAETYTIQALELRWKLLGEHQDTARSHIRLSEVLFIQGKYELALTELEVALDIQKDVLGHEHQVTLGTMERKREVLEALGRVGRDHEAVENIHGLEEKLKRL